MTMEPTEARFHETMFGIYERAKRECNYNATRFLKMVGDRGGLEAARRLILSDEPSDGFTELWLHGRLDLPDLVPLYEEFREMPVVSISNNQRQPLPDVNWQATVYHGLPTDLLRYHPKPGQYLAFIGRFSPEKGADQAIEIAKRAQLPLKLAAKVDRADEEYFEREIKPLLDHPLLEYVGEIGENDKDDFLGDAYALLFPIAWPEPFGLVMIEAMACGTPVIAYRHGSVAELMEDGRSGFIVNDVDGAVSAVRRAAEVRRADVRNVFERRFTATQMASDYLRVYERVIAQHHRRARAPAA